MSEHTTAGMPFAANQNMVYLGGLADRLPRLPIDVEALHAAFQRVQTAGPRGYVDGGAGTEATIRANREALDRRQLVPRMLRDVSVRESRRKILGTEWPAPVGLAPIGMQSIVHPEGELAVARAAAELGVPLIASTLSSYTLEEIAAASGDAPRWFQLYWPRDRELAASLIARAEAAGYVALVVTLDTWLLGWRPRDLQHAYLPSLRGTGLANYFSDPVFRSALARPPEEDRMAAVGHFLGVFSDPSVTWDDLAFLRDSARVPIVLKGIQHPDDARRVAASGLDGVIVSNHGGRQLDGAVGSLDALERVVDANTELEILFDSGVRSAADVAKALAVGARAALVGRPYMWALGVAGADGVAEFLRNLLAELDLTLALSGHAHVDELGRGSLVQTAGWAR